MHQGTQRNAKSCKKTGFSRKAKAISQYQAKLGPGLIDAIKEMTPTTKRLEYALMFVVVEAGGSKVQ